MIVKELNRHPLLVYVTACFLLLAMWFGAVFTPEPKLPPLLIDTNGAPTLGLANAHTHVILFQDPLCLECKDFYLSIFPELKSVFVDSGKIAFTAISIATLPASKIPAEAFLSMYYQDLNKPNPELFFKFVSYWYAHFPNLQGETSIEALAETAKTFNPDLNVIGLRLELKEQMWRQKVEKDTAYAQVLTEGNNAMPIFFIDGVRTLAKDKESLFSQIRDRLQEKGNL